MAIFKLVMIVCEDILFLKDYVIMLISVLGETLSEIDQLITQT